LPGNDGISEVETTGVRGSLLGKSPKVVLRWAKGYLKLRMPVRKLPRGVLRELIGLALRQLGTRPGVTKTKLRKAAAVLFAQPRPPAGAARPGAA
jgi:hypothetical protein